MNEQTHGVDRNFNEELSTIKDKTIREQCIKVLENVNGQFYTAPASSTGKYHPNYALGDGGLWRHTKAAVKIANCLLELDMYKEKFSNSLQDYIRCALILHDTCKSGKNWTGQFTEFDHPLQACELIRETLGEDGAPDNEFVEAVNNLICTHMGQWNTSKYSKVILPVPISEPQKFVHMCDYLASRKFLEIIFD